ncbi:MAG: tryptophan synthase subunit alpha [Candidatus Melainabacteria bacterium RIFCSPLOWO2_02_FULL_35_15]|nr:MAG: tryptophan synthase subunit alpha [Candidatus Melainabacteria bacterium RIFCSPLOWO2_12_FULL_35_11]OGI14477.1 MAG: tryptophan synthase subunit alpha [Candidatus Melainabacteria bacterium RIFCSPLOWO2_02_FULL_35_15]
MNKNPLLIPYITAGFPAKKLFLPILKTLSENSADFIEVGMPHSDPLADGHVIQHSSKVALENGVTLKWIIDTSRDLHLREIKPLILFSYLNPVLQYGFEKLLKDLPKPLFYGLIIPDLPLEEAEKYLPLFKKHKLHLIPLVAPTTNKEKIKKIVRAYCNISLSDGFIYLVSAIGVTGARQYFSKDLKNKIKEIKSYTTKPVVVGFGISNLKQAKEVISYGADGIVIGSALIKILMETKNNKAILKLKKFIRSFKNK